MPRLKLSSRASLGPLVTISGQVMSGAGSPGQQVCTGRLARSISSPRSTISWQAGEPTVFGRIDITVLASGHSSIASPKLRGGSGWRRVASTSPTSRNDAASCRSTPFIVTPMATRFTVPNRLARTGMGDGVPSALRGFSKMTAGPPSASRRVWISVISRTVDTGSRTRTSSPSASSLAMKSRSDR